MRTLKAAFDVAIVIQADGTAFFVFSANSAFELSGFIDLAFGSVGSLGGGEVVSDGLLLQIILALLLSLKEGFNLLSIR